MTENEKAATFAGWNPDTVCDGYFVGQSDRSSRQVFCGCGVCKLRNRNCMTARLHVHDEHHLRKAPDMSLPANYMKAQVAWSILTHRESWPASPLNSISPRGYGKTPVAALAALYDLEHPEEKELNG